MAIKEDIIVVAPDRYKGEARETAHLISKETTYNGLFWSVEQYEVNEFQLGGDQLAIFIGNEQENQISKGFFPIIKTWENQAGACYGFDASKAIVFGEGNLDKKDEFYILLKKLDIDNKAGKFKMLNDFARSTVIKHLFPVAAYFNEKIVVRQLRALQTKAALVIFLSENFKDWIGKNKTE